MDKATAINDLAEWLHFCMKALDPERPETEWSDLSESERDFYESCVEMLLDRRDLVSRALADNDVVERRAKLGKKPDGDQ